MLRDGRLDEEESGELMSFRCSRSLSLGQVRDGYTVQIDLEKRVVPGSKAEKRSRPLSKSRTTAEEALAARATTTQGSMGMQPSARMLQMKTKTTGTKTRRRRDVEERERLEGEEEEREDGRRQPAATAKRW